MTRPFLFFFLFFFTALQAQVLERDLSKEHWAFSISEKNDFLPAKIPGTVHTDLYRNKRIEDPFFGDNEKKIQWIENKDWVYTTSFLVTQQEIKFNHQELVFEGLDTYAQVKLNGQVILDADNMFRQWQVNIKEVLHVGKNNLEIVFFSAVKKGKDLALQLPYTLPGDEKVFTRKAQYQYGWDWGPRFVTAGIWKPIKLKFWDFAMMKEVSVSQNIQKDKAELDFQLEILADQKGTVSVEVNQSKYTFTILKGITILHCPYLIKNPKLWWPNGLGDATLYSFQIQMMHNGKLLGNKQLQLGLRTIDLVQEKDTDGKSFYFKVNGVPVYMKGANVIPFHSFLPEVSSNTYTKMVLNAREAHMNMLRVWGGGVYGDDDFYKACDQNGILVWQDFMFACAMYPVDKAFVSNVTQEATDQVKRLQNHPSLALWCGNNESDEGWKNWEWQKQYKYSSGDSTTIWKNYETLFHRVLPKVVDSLSANKTIYWPSSPSIGWGHPESLTQGDSHYWGVWWGVEPIEQYQEKVGRFMSEYGLQGMPDVATFKAVMSPEDYKNGTSEAFKNHQKHPNGTAYIKTYIERDFKVPKTFEHYVFVSQLQQALGLKIAIESHRRAKPYNMGTLYWQLNDCWPVTSWSSIDFFGRKKALQYQVKESFEPVLLSVHQTAQTLELFSSNDELKAYSGEFKLQLISFEGKVLWEHSFTGNIDKNTSQKQYGQSLSLFSNFNLNQAFLKMSFKSSDKILENIHFFSKPKDLILGQAPILFKRISKNTLEIRSSTLKKDVFLSGEGCEFGDNYFDLLPNTPKYVSFKGMVKNIKELSLGDIP